MAPSSLAQDFVSDCQGEPNSWWTKQILSFRGKKETHFVLFLKHSPFTAGVLQDWREHDPAALVREDPQDPADRGHG